MSGNENYYIMVPAGERPYLIERKTNTVMDRVFGARERVMAEVEYYARKRHIVGVESPNEETLELNWYLYAGHEEGLRCFFEGDREGAVKCADADRPVSLAVRYTPEKYATAVLVAEVLLAEAEQPS